MGKSPVQIGLKACYNLYILRSKRAESPQETDSKADEDKDSEEDRTKFKPPGRSKGRKTEEGKKPCIICNQVPFKGHGNLYRIIEKRAKLLLCAIELNLDEVYTRCSPVKHIFAADIVSHKNCMKSISCNINEILKKLSIMMKQVMI